MATQTELFTPEYLDNLEDAAYTMLVEQGAWLDLTTDEEAEQRAFDQEHLQLLAAEIWVCELPVTEHVVLGGVAC